MLPTELMSDGLRRVRKVIRRAEDETDHLGHVARDGDSGETPFLAIAGVILVLLPFGGLLAAFTYGAIWLFG
jgi:hypothetical protein